MSLSWIICWLYMFHVMFSLHTTMFPEHLCSMSLPPLWRFPHICIVLDGTIRSSVHGALEYYWIWIRIKYLGSIYTIRIAMCLTSTDWSYLHHTTKQYIASATYRMARNIGNPNGNFTSKQKRKIWFWWNFNLAVKVVSYDVIMKIRTGLQCSHRFSDPTCWPPLYQHGTSNQI